MCLNLELFLSGFISSLPQLAWEKRLCCCLLLFVITSGSDHTYAVVVLQTTAGWRKAPALAQRVCTQGVASLRSISLKNTRNTAGFRVVRAAGA